MVCLYHAFPKLRESGTERLQNQKVVDNFNETAFSRYNKAGRCTHELTENMTACTGPEQFKPNEVPAWTMVVGTIPHL